MPINIGELVVALSTNNIESAIGKSVTVKATFTNTSTYPGYNLYSKITLPNGVSFVSASILGEQISYSNNDEIVEFINIRDLYPNESYTLDIQVMVDESYRNSGIDVPFNTVISGIIVEGVLDSKPRGNIDVGNLKVTSTVTATATGKRYYFKIVFPPVYLKGAGGTLTDTPLNPFDITFEIVNNTRESTSLDSINIDLANGIRYIDTNYSATGIDSSQFQSLTTPPPPTVVGLGEGHDNYTISFSSLNLSAGSDNIVKFQGAIWNQYTANGIENSGDVIVNGTSLSSQVTVSTGSQFEYEYGLMVALEFYIEKLVDSTTTDVSQINNFTLNYKVGGYTALNNIIINDIIGDGLSYIIDSATIPFDTLTDLGNGITQLTWNIGSLVANSLGTINISADTLQKYFNGNFISVGDTLSNDMNASWTDSVSGVTDTLDSEVLLNVTIPTMTKTVIGYYDESLTEKTIENATKGEYVGFLISYDGTNINAQQSGVKVFDYAPLSMILTSVPTNIVYTGDIPQGISPELVDSNGILWPIGNLPGNSSFTIEFKLQVTEFNSEFNNNLAKMDVLNVDGISFSVRDTVSIAIATSNPSIDSTVTATTTQINGAVLNSVYDYLVNIENKDLSLSGNPISAIYNSEVTIGLPTEFSFYNTGGLDVTPVATVIGGTIGIGAIISATEYVLPVTVLNPDGKITIEFKGKASSVLVADKSYTVTSTMTQGTTAANEPYENYPGDNLVSQSTVIADTIELSKVVTPSIVPLHGGYSTVVNLTVPKGIIAYNVVFTDNTISNNNSLVTDVMLNGITPASGYTVSNNIITVPIATVIDTTENEYVCELTFNDVATNFTGGNTNFQVRSLTTKVIWGSAAGESNTVSSTIYTNITIVAPTLSLNLLQSNSVSGYSYTEDTLIAKAYDDCIYKFEIDNIGYSSAYGLIITDTLPENIEFVSYGNVLGNYNSLTRTVTFNISELANSEVAEIYFYVRVKGNISDNYVIAVNTGQVQYDSIVNDSTHFNTVSNSVMLVRNPLTAQKLQKNLTTSSIFVKDAEEIITGQEMSYKIIISNVGEEELTNLSISDTFSQELTFVSFEPFSKGTLSVSNNNISGTITLLEPGKTVEIIYTVRMDIDVLRSYISRATVYYSIENQQTVMTKYSNNLVTLLYGIGRGYTIY